MRDSGTGRSMSEGTLPSAGDREIADPSATNSPPRNAPPDLGWLNRRLRDLLLHAPSAIGVTAGPQHLWIYVNEARVAMAGRAGADDFVGKTVRESYPELEGGPFFERLDEVYRTGVPYVGKELRADFRREANGAPDAAYVDCLYQPFFTPDGNVEGILIHTVEVTEKVEARRVVEFERNQYRALLTQAPAGIGIMAGPEHRWTFANPVLCRMSGRSWEEMAHRPFRGAMPEGEAQGLLNILDSVYQTGKPYVGTDIKLMLKRGPSGEMETGYFNLTYQPVRSVSGEVEAIMMLVAEVTQQRNARTELETLVEERTQDLRRAHESLRTLSGCLMRAQDDERRKVARELHDSTGQYLAAVQMNLSTLADEPAMLDEKLRRRMKDTMELVDHCTAEIRTLSYLLHPPLLDEVGLAGAIAWYAEGFSERSGIALTLDLPKGLPRFSSDFETALFRVVQETLINVHRHSGSKLAKIELTMIGQATQGGRLRMEIHDEGRGFPADMLSRFQKTGQLPGSGVSGVRERISALGGTLDISSGAAGSRICVDVPIPEGSRLAS